MRYELDCARCGRHFVAVRAQTQNPPRFCSVKCFDPGPEARMMSRFNKGPGCWLWRDPSPFGYGVIWIAGRPVKAHRAVYELLVGPIPEGHELDHVCHTKDETCPGGLACLHRACVRPDHLEAVRPGENWRRGKSFSAINARKKLCPKGHSYDPEYRRKRYGCRVCALNRAKAQRERQSKR